VIKNADFLANIKGENFGIKTGLPLLKEETKKKTFRNNHLGFFKNCKRPHPTMGGFYLPLPFSLGGEGAP